jgi:hypothetical protein
MYQFTSSVSPSYVCAVALTLIFLFRRNKLRITKAIKAGTAITNTIGGSGIAGVDVGVGLGLGLGEVVGDEDGNGLVEGDGDGDGDKVGVGLYEGVGDGVGDGDRITCPTGRMQSGTIEGAMLRMFLRV